MKRTLALIMATLLCCVSLSLVSCGSDAPSGMKLASGEAVDYLFYVPENWVIDMSTGVSSAYISEDDRTNVSVTFYKIEDGETAENYWERYQNEYKNIFGEFTDLTVSDTTLDGKAAKLYVYSASVNSYDYKFMQAFCVNNGRIYIMTFTASPEKFEEHYEKFDYILGDFKFM